MAKKSAKQRLKEKCVSLAMDIYLKNHPNCEICVKRADVVHHFIHQSRSNYLRCDFRNFVSMDKGCHYKVHNGYEQLITGQLIKQRGQNWFDSMQADSTKTIKDNLDYWKKMYEHLKELEAK
jgi:hypothetical protein